MIFKTFPRNIKNICLSFIFCLCLSGCHVLNPRDAGAPIPSYDIEDDLKQLQEHFQPAKSIEKYYENPGANSRNEVISGRLAMINLNYLDWLRTITSDKQLLDTAADVLLLSLNLAGTAVGGAAAKTTLAAISAGIAGSKTSIDKHYFYEKTISALIAEMNAQRTTILVKILNGMNADINEYPFEKAVSDIHEYYQAGTLAGAISSVQADAGAKQNKAIKKLPPSTPDRNKLLRNVQDVILNLREDQKASAKKVIEQMTGTHEKLSNLVDVRRSLLNIWRNTEDDDEFIDSMKDNGLIN